MKRIKQAFADSPNPTMPQNAVQVLLAVFRTISQSGIKLYAIVLTYYTLLAIVPLLAVLFTLLKRFGIDTFLQGILLDALAPLGNSGQEISHYLLQFIQNTQTHILGSISVVFLLFSIFGLFGKIDQALNRMWFVKSPNNWGGQILGYAGAILLTVVFAMLALTLNLSSKTSILQSIFGDTQLSFWLITAVSKTASVLFTALMLAIMYSSTINIKVQSKAALAGGFFCALLWIPLTMLFAHTIVISKNYSVIYSGFAGIIILLIWLNILWLLFLSGGLVAYFVQFPALLRPYSSKPLNAAEIRHFSHVIIETISDNTHHGKGYTTFSELIAATRLNHQQITTVIQPFLTRQLLIRERGSDARFRLDTTHVISEKTIQKLAFGEVNSWRIHR